MTRLFKRLLFCLLLALLLLPALQAKFTYFDEKPLGGLFIGSVHPELTWEALLNNTYQSDLEKYLEDRLGFRPDLIRLRNQLCFSLFRVPRSSGIVVGRHDMLYEALQIQSYAGHDRLDAAVVRFRVRRLRAVQRELARRGVQLLFVMAPNKARFQPEDLPTALQAAPGTVTNYDLYRQAMQADTVAVLNMVPLFAQWKKTKPYPLFSRAGTHWSGYGATLAADTLLRQLEQMGGMHFPTVRTVGLPLLVRTTDSLRANDNDLAKPLNLFQQAETIPVAYRRLAFDPPQPGQTRPPTLFVGDSFTWGLAQFSPYLLREFADDTRIWYYGINVHLPDSLITYTGAQCQNLDLKQQIESRRFIVLMVTEHNLIKQEFDFTNRVYRLYHPLTAADNAAIDQIAQKMTQQAIDKDGDAAWAEQAKDTNGYMTRIRKNAEEAYEMAK